MLETVRKERLRAVLKMVAYLEKEPKHSPILTCLGTLVLMVGHTIGFLVQLLWVFIKLPFVFLRYALLTPAVMLYAWADGLILIFWFGYKTITRRKE